MKTCPVAPSAILIDLDGTLADSLSVMRKAYQMFLAGFHVEGMDAEFLSLNGPPLIEVVRRLKVAHNLPYDEDTLVSRYSRIMDKLYCSVSPAHGARQLLSTAKLRGCRVLVVTSNSADRASAWLDRVDLTQFVDATISGEQVKNGKPDPEPYLLAASVVGCPIHQIIAIEDSIQGATSAVGAGLFTYLLTSLPKKSVAYHPVVPALSLEQIAIDIWGH